VTELEKALVAAQADLQNPPKTSTARVPTKSGGSFSYTYAPLPEILDAVRPALFRHGLVLAQDVVGEGGYVGVSTHLIHESGERLISGPVMLPATDPQQAGAIITYLRRYSVCAILGIAADEDTDASVKPFPAAGPGGVVTPSGGAVGDSTSGPAAGGSSARPAPDPGPGSTSAPSGEVGADAGAGEAPTSSPASTKAYGLDPAKCSHRFPSGRWLKWDEFDCCPRCGTPRLTAMEGTTADLGPA
jgi:hypothetical protein